MSHKLQVFNPSRLCQLRRWHGWHRGRSSRLGAMGKARPGWEKHTGPSPSLPPRDQHGAPRAKAALSCVVSGERLAHALTQVSLASEGRKLADVTTEKSYKDAIFRGKLWVLLHPPRPPTPSLGKSPHDQRLRAPLHKFPTQKQLHWHRFC